MFSSLVSLSYPSGRLAVLRLPRPNPSTLFFDDTEIEENRFLGLVTSTGSVFLMQPSLHARFTTDNAHERAYLCDGRTGIIDKQLQYHFNRSGTQSVLSNQTTSNDDEDILPPFLENTVQIQINSTMQLEFQNPTNIRFAFACQKEEFKFQLGTHLPSQSPLSIDSLKKSANDKKSQSKSKLSTILSNSTTTTTTNNEILEKQQIQIERLLDGQVNLRELPMMKELTTMKKRIRHICNSWLKDYRMTLG